MRGLKLAVTTDRGVFSHGRVDRGSRLLAESVAIAETDEVLDWGCGWGLVGIVVARTWPDARVTMIDVNERACELARTNARDNGARNVEVVCGDAADVLAERSFDAILVNPPISAGRQTVLAVFDWCAAHLREAGTFWVVAATRKGAKTLGRLLGERFDDVQQVALGGGFRVYAATGPPQGGS